MDFPLDLMEIPAFFPDELVFNPDIHRPEDACGFGFRGVHEYGKMVEFFIELPGGAPDDDYAALMVARYLCKLAGILSATITGKAGALFMVQLVGRDGAKIAATLGTV